MGGFSRAVLVEETRRSLNSVVLGWEAKGTQVALDRVSVGGSQHSCMEFMGQLGRTHITCRLHQPGFPSGGSLTMLISCEP